MIEHVTEIHLFYPLLFVLTIIITFVISRTYKDKLDFKKDVEITSEAFNKIGEVRNGTPNELILNLQNIENNKEIFCHDKKIDDLEQKVEFLLKENANLRADYSVLKNRFDSLIKVVGREE